MAPGSPQAVVRKRFTMLKRALPPAVRGDADAVHDARVATRQLRAVLPVAGKRSRPLEGDMRRLTALLGSIRELDVALANLAAMQAQRRVSAAVARAARAELAAKRQVARRALREAIGASLYSRLERRTSTVARESGDVCRPAEAAQEAWERVRARARRLAGAIRKAGRNPEPARLHAVRLAAKKLRYVYEAALELAGVGRRSAEVATLKRAQDVLGRLHDLELLAGFMQQIGSTPRAVDAGDSVSVFVRWLRRRCRRLQRRYLELEPALLAATRRVRKTARRACSARAA